MDGEQQQQKKNKNEIKMKGKTQSTRKILKSRIPNF